MKKSGYVLIVAGLATAALAACQRQHPVSVYVNPVMTAVGPEDQPFQKIAVFPWVSSLHASEDPDHIAERTMESLFLRELEKRNDYQ